MTKPTVRESPHPRYSHEVEWRQGVDASGKLKRRKKFFRSEHAAKDFLRKKQIEMRTTPVESAPVSSTEFAAIEIARDRGLNILELVQAAATRKDKVEESISVMDAVDERIRSAKEAGRSERYLGDLRARLGRFAVKMPDVKMTEVTRDMVWDFVMGLGVSPTSVRNELRVISGLFRYAAKRGWCESDPTVSIDKPKVRRGRIEILTPRQAKELLKVAEQHGMLAPIAIGLFAGIRSAELRRITWRMITDKHVQVPLEVAKSSRRRLVDMEPNLAEILSQVEDRKGKVWKPGKDAWARLKEDLSYDWPSNAMRHSYASYHLARGEDASKTAMMLGHTSNNVLYEHYREVVTNAQGKAWFRITLQN